MSQADVSRPLKDAKHTSARLQIIFGSSSQSHQISEEKEVVTMQDFHPHQHKSLYLPLSIPVRPPSSKLFLDVSPSSATVFLLLGSYFGSPLCIPNDWGCGMQHTNHSPNERTMGHLPHQCLMLGAPKQETASNTLHHSKPQAHPRYDQ